MKNNSKFNYGIFLGLTLFVSINYVIPILQGVEYSGSYVIVVPIWIATGIWTLYNGIKYKKLQPQ